MINTHKAFFHTQDGEIFQGNDPARGPWQADACHAGPVTGLIARAFEQLITDKQLMRLSVELVKPVPLAGFYIETQLCKTGRAVSTATGELKDLKGKVIARASSLHMVEQQLSDLPSAPFVQVPFEETHPGDFILGKPQHGLPFFGSCVEVRYPPGEDNSPGPTTLWMRTPPLLEDEEPTPFQRLCPLADCGNGISRNLEIWETSCINPDITIVMHRQSNSKWFGSQAQSFWQSTGMGLAQAILFDDDGPVGSAMQTILLQQA